jgi:hypothetical protein
MLNRTETKPLVIEALTEFVEANKTFTAWDINLELRAKGHQINHVFVRETVHEAMYPMTQAGIYTVDLVDYTDANGDVRQANTYAPVSADDDDDPQDDASADDDDPGIVIAIASAPWTL